MGKNLEHRRTGKDAKKTANGKRGQGRKEFNQFDNNLSSWSLVSVLFFQLLTSRQE